MVATTVDEYLAGLPGLPRAALDQVRATVRAAVPEATESISYGIPTVRLGGRMLLSYAAFARHCSLFPASAAVMAALGDELAPYFTPKATLRFAPDAPIPRPLLERIVAIRVGEVTSA
jgi:uncharacterized protein YdhG (YjbR/CyaY superfamily)